MALEPKGEPSWLTAVLRHVAAHQPGVAAVAIVAIVALLILAGCAGTPLGDAAAIAEVGADRFCESWLNSHEPINLNGPKP
jgi:hypothetical protein